MAFIHKDFLLQSSAAQQLYHEYAEDQPILDYHCHLPPQDIASNRQFADLFEIWLEGDHYKWRAMRANGIDEKYITGDAEPFEKFMAWAQTVPKTLRNPLFHWTALELKRYFGIDELLNADSAQRIWDQTKEQLADPSFSTRGLLKRFDVQLVCTTDDPCDDLVHHQAVNAEGCSTRLLPTFRPDGALNTQDAAGFNAYADQLAELTGKDTASLEGLLLALDQRHAFFHEQGGRLSDRGIAEFPCPALGIEAAAKAVAGLRAGQALSEADAEGLQAYLLIELGRMDAKRGWATQLHIGPIRNNSTRSFKALGRDTGFDSIGDGCHAEGMRYYLDALDQTGELPKTILYNINPTDNYLFATMAGNFQDGSIPGKIQFGSGWWFLDQKEGIEWQVNALSNLGLLSRFIGMLTDSRSFMSFPRHEYFRRVVCNMLGAEMENGELPNDFDLVGGMVSDICCHNAKAYLGL